MNTNEATIGRWLTPKQAAAYLQISLRALQRMQANGRIPFNRIGERTVRFDRLALDKWAESRAEVA